MLRAWIFKPAIILFCLFHMTAVAGFSISTNWNIAPLTFFRETTVLWTRGYILMTSQWQQWNLFSPDPLRRVSRYRVQAQSNGIWQEGAWLDEGVSYHRKANMTKTLRRLEEHEYNSPTLTRFLALACREGQLSPGTAIRLERTYYVLPTPERPLTRAQWRAYEPEWTTDTMAETSCPAMP